MWLIVRSRPDRQVVAIYKCRISQKLSLHLTKIVAVRSIFCIDLGNCVDESHRNCRWPTFVSHILSLADLLGTFFGHRCSSKVWRVRRSLFSPE
jgi:hypothetical protein